MSALKTEHCPEKKGYFSSLPSPYLRRWGRGVSLKVEKAELSLGTDHHAVRQEAESMVSQCGLLSPRPRSLLLHTGVSLL